MMMMMMMVMMMMNCSFFLLISFALVCTSTATLYDVSKVTNYTSGGFIVSYSPQELPTLRITEQDKPVWFTSYSQSSFVHASKVNIHTSQIGGNYIIKHDVIDKCDQMDITKVSQRPPTSESAYSSISIQGMLCNKVAIEIDFQAVTVATNDTTKGGITTNRTHLRFNISMEDNTSYNQLHLVYGCEEDEGFYGFGAQYSELNMKGKQLPLFLSEQGVGRGLQPVTFILDLISPGAGGKWSTTYTRVPHYITSHQRSLLLESLDYAVFSFIKDDEVTLMVDSNDIVGRIITGSSPLDIITSYTALVGRLPLLPKWVGSGAILGLQGGTESVKHTVFDMVRNTWGNLSDVAGVWLQDWTGQRNFSGANELPRVGLWWNWEVDDTHYPNWSQLVSDLSAVDIKMLTYINPLFSNISGRGTPFHHNYYEEGLERDFFVRSGESGEVWTGYSNATLLDLTNPSAYKWMVDIIAENMLATGACGWMCDFGESVPLDAVLHDRNVNPAHFHSMYPSLWGQLNSDAIKKAGTLHCKDDDVVYFMRSGNVFSPSTSRSFWLGDQMVTWDQHDGLASVVMGMLSQGLSGYSLTHSDIGGYTALLKPPLLKYIRSKELYLRWCELAAFSSMYRSHLGTLPTDNWQFDSDNQTLHHFFKMAVVFQSWDFYRQELAKEATELGWPIARHMMLAFPSNRQVYQERLNQQFMLGSELLVAPVLKAGVEEVEVFLPAGSSWVSVWGDGSVYKGSDEFVTVKAPIGQPCVLFPPTSKVGERFLQNLKMRKLL